MGNDTIAAIATPAGVGGLAVLRLSGPDAAAIVSGLTTLRTPFKPRHATYTTLLANGEQLDEAIITYYPAPHSYTGEDCVEVCCHGSQYIQQTLLQTLIEHGARLADPGEFTMRAFLGGKMDLSQAEAVADLIDATSQGAHRLAARQLRGQVSTRLADLREQLIHIASLMELELDFSEEPVEFADRGELLRLLDSIEATARPLAESFSMGNAVKSGIRVAIAGAPNVGKSTLLNALTGDDRAIVSHVPGTTRDTIEECVTISGLLFRFIDTAGLRHSTDTIEQAGMERSLRAIEQADTVLLVADGDTPFPQIPEEKLQGKQVIRLFNKVDISSPDTTNATIAISAKQGLGLDSLREALAAPYLTTQSPDAMVLTNARHHQALTATFEALENARQGLMEQRPTDLTVIDIRDALYHIGTITGQVSDSEILHKIFANFCVGK